jgi:hypothetical protein
VTGFLQDALRLSLGRGNFSGHVFISKIEDGFMRITFAISKKTVKVDLFGKLQGTS